MMQKFLLALSFTGMLISCADDKKDKPVSVSTEIKMLTSPAADSCAEPYLFTDKNGIVFLSWTEKKGKEAALKFSTYKNDAWSAPVTVAVGNNWFVNWADYSVIASDGDNNVIAHYLEKSDTAKFTYDVKLIASSDSGKIWADSYTLHDDGKKAEHGFVSLIPYNDGFFACWLDGRKTASEEGHGGHDGHHGEMTVRAALLDKKGKKISEWELDGKACDCCQTTAAITTNGPVVVYRDRSDDEIRDMSIVRLINGEWTKPVTINPDNWKIKACPVNGPRADAIGNNLAIGWFSMAEKKGEVKMIFSKDGGATFGKPVRIDEGNAIGRVDVVMVDSTTAFISWMEGLSIKAVKVDADGIKGNTVTIASSSDKRSSGFPQITKAGDKIIFAWTDDKAKTVKTAVVDL